MTDNRPIYYRAIRDLLHHHQWDDIPFEDPITMRTPWRRGEKKTTTKERTDTMTWCSEWMSCVLSEIQLPNYLPWLRSLLIDRVEYNCQMISYEVVGAAETASLSQLLARPRRWGTHAGPEVTPGGDGDGPWARGLRRGLPKFRYFWQYQNQGR